MKLGFTLGSNEKVVKINLDFIREAEAMGYEVVRTSESYGSDAVSRAAWILAQTSKIKVGTGIMQFGARTPALTAMTTITLDQLSGGRFLLGLGLSGPQVIEGWHGVPFGKPLGVTREYLTIVRKIFDREAPVAFEGKFYQVPYTGPGSTGLGKPLKSITHPRKGIPIYLAAMGPKNVTLAAELADGLIPGMFSPERFHLMDKLLKEGFAKAGNGKSYANFDLSPAVPVVLGDDVKACRDELRPYYAHYIGGMGAKDRNFHNDNVRRLGFEDMAARIQGLYMSGKKAEAERAVTDEFIDEVALCGPRDRIKDRLQRYLKLPIQTFQVRFPKPATLRLMADLMR